MHSLEQVETSTDCQVTISMCFLQTTMSVGDDLRSKLLNLTGFFSSFGAALPMTGTPVTGVELILWGFLVEDTGPDQGKRVLRRK